MKLIRVSIENFGVLHDLKLEFEELQVFCEDNGWGKSTLTAFLRIMFFGFENEGVRKDIEVLNEREKYRPWQGGTYGGSLVFAIGEELYEVTRIFRENKRMDSFTLRDARTNLVSDRYSSEIGPEIFGLDGESFERTILLAQNDCLTHTTDRIVAKLSNLTELTDDLNAYEETDTRLKDLINEYSPSRKTGKIYRLREEIEELKAMLQSPDLPGASGAQALELRYAGERVSEHDISPYESERLEQLEKRFAEGTPGTQTIDHMMDLVTARAEASRKLERFETRLETIEQMQRSEVVQNRYEEPSNAQTNSVVAAKILLILIGVVAIVGGILGAIYWNRIGYYIAGAGVLVFFVGVLLRRKARTSQVESEEEYDTYEEETDASEQEENIRSWKQEIRSLEKQIRRESTIIDEMNRKLDDFLQLYALEDDSQDVSMLLVGLRSDLKEYEQLRVKTARYQHAKDRYAQSVQKVTAQLETAQSELERQENFYRQLCLTREYLSRARDQFGGQLQGPILDAFSKYYRMLCPEEPVSFRLDAKMNLTLESHGEQHDVRNLSLGLRELAGVCLRLALIDVMYPNEKPFLIFDDSFANMDKLKISRAMELVKNVSKSYQILYFTCHEDRCP